MAPAAYTLCMTGSLQTPLARRRFLGFGLGALTAMAAPLAWSRQGPLAILLAQDWQPGTNPSRYLVSEKLDGVRAVWDGQALRFRSGLPIAAPAWFVAKLPGTPLDGELWLARGQFDALSGMVRKAKPVNSEWQQVRYQVFELPGAPGTFTQRSARLREVVQAANWPSLQAVQQFTVADEKALNARLDEVVKSGGEGLVLHLADAPYTTGRSAVLLKYKPVADAEAVVIGHLPGKGKYAGQLGALQVQTADGQRFKLGTGFSDEQRQNPPPVGSSVTYTYRDKTPSGKPRFAAFLRVQRGI
jgi:DNA ligase 1